jgi:hypothetical protein
MADPTRAGQLQKLREHCAKPPRGVLFDEAGGLFLDTATGKTCALDLPNLMQVEERADRETKRPYLLLVYGDGRQLALTDAGLAFAPRFDHTGPLSDLPEAVCLRDYHGMVDRLKHDLYGHRDEAPTRQTVKLVMMCLAVLEGAKAVGLDVGREERELETHLTELERRAPPP